MPTHEEILAELGDGAIAWALQALADEWYGLDDAPSADDCEALARAIGE